MYVVASGQCHVRAKPPAPPPASLETDHHALEALKAQAARQENPESSSSGEHMSEFDTFFVEFRLI